MQKKWIVLGAVVLFFVILGGSCVAKYNKLVSLDEKVKGQWSQVENAYQRRADLVTQELAIVKGAANFEKDTYIAVTQARSKVASVDTKDITSNPDKLKQFEAAQNELGAQFSRLMVTVEAYPDLKATQNFRDFQAQVEGSENRITVERQRFNEAAQEFNTTRRSFPMSLFAGMFGFQDKAYFQAKPGTDTPPEIKF
jgi:LemA protein